MVGGQRALFLWWKSEVDGVKDGRVARRGSVRAGAIARRWPGPLAGAGRRSGWSETREEREVIGHDRGPDAGLESDEPAPGAAGEAIGALQAGDAGLDAARKFRSRR